MAIWDTRVSGVNWKATPHRFRQTCDAGDWFGHADGAQWLKNKKVRGRGDKFDEIESHHLVVADDENDRGDMTGVSPNSNPSPKRKQN